MVTAVPWPGTSGAYFDAFSIAFRTASPNSPLDARFQRTDAKIDALQRRMTSLILASWVTLMGATLLRHSHGLAKSA
jgi:hypothetical protein